MSSQFSSTQQEVLKVRRVLSVFPETGLFISAIFSEATGTSANVLYFLKEQSYLKQYSSTILSAFELHSYKTHSRETDSWAFLLSQ